MDSVQVAIFEVAFDSGMKLGAVTLLGVVVITAIVIIAKTANRSI